MRMWSWNVEGTLEKVKVYNKSGIANSIALLPALKNREKQLEQEHLSYKYTIEQIKKRNLNSDITIKLNQFGVYGDYKLMRKYVEKVLKEAKKNNVFVWIDMEMPSTVDATIRIYREMHQNYKEIGICLQAYSKRTEKDLNFLLKEKGAIRLVKGFYAANDFETWQEVTNNYKKLMKILLLKGSRPCIATHDLELINYVKELIKKHKIKNAEIQMFAGVRDDLAKKLVKEGFNVRLYITYGNIFAYLTRLFTFDISRTAQRILHFERIR